MRGTYDVALRRVRATNVTVEKQEILHNMGVCRLWRARLYHIFPHYLINRTIVWEKELLNITFVSLITSTTSV
jgi:hypothetical protein